MFGRYAHRRANWYVRLVSHISSQAVQQEDSVNDFVISARLPCLCIYHKVCIDNWWKVNRICPEHPDD